LLIEYRELSKLKSTYVDALPGFIHRRRAHPHELQSDRGRHGPAVVVRTRTCRISRCALRAAKPFAAPSSLRPARCLLTADYSQIELRLLAHLSGDPAFVEAFEQGGDIHRQTAAIISAYARPGHAGHARPREDDQFRHDLRAGAIRPVRQLGITQDDAKRFIEQYFTRFAGVRAWLDRTVAEAREKGMSRHCSEAALHTGVEGPQLQHPSVRRANCYQLPASGLGCGLDQDRHDRIAGGLKQRGLASRMILQSMTSLYLRYRPGRGKPPQSW